MSQNPEFFGKYILLEKLATGGMAEVYLAKAMGAENVSKFMAVKRILPQFSQSAEFIDMFKEEAKIAINLAHSNIVTITEFGEERGQFFLVMEYVEGRNLRQIINRIQNTGQRLSIENVVYIINEVSRGLDAAHRCVDANTGKPLNITHRDISPQNVMVNFEGEVKICDFGIAKAESKIENTQAGTLKGKFGYMSPEQAEGQDVDFRTDIFSLGIVLWELIAQDRLFLSNNELNTLRKIRDCQIPSLRKIDPNVPPELERITGKSLTKDRNLRYQNAAEFHRDLNRFLNRQYPDFSSQDFSTFIKNLYSKEREDHRQKLIAYGKIQTNPASANEHTQYIPRETLSKTVTDTRSLPQPGNFDLNSPLDSSQGGSLLRNLTMDEISRARIESLDMNPNSNPGIRAQRDLEQKMRSGSIVQKPDSMHLMGHTNPGLQRRTTKQSGSQVGTFAARSENTYGRAFETPPSRGNFLSKVVTIVFIFAGLTAVAGLYFKTRPEELDKYILMYPVIKDFIPQKYFEMQNRVVVAPTPTPAPKPKGPISKLLVSSTPPGANIYINNESTQQVTPAQVEVSTNEPYTILIERDGFVRYCARRTTAPGSESLDVELKRSEMGFVAVEVRPSEAIVYVNDCPVPTRANKGHIQIPAGTEVKVSAYNALVRSYAEERVTVKKDTSKTVTLFLRKLEHAPAGNQ